MAVAWATTVTVSATPAACSERSRLNSWPTTRGSVVYSSGAKPLISTRSVYVDGFRFGMT
jgi:hypothetical protein